MGRRQVPMDQMLAHGVAQVIWWLLRHKLLQTAHLSEHVVKVAPVISLRLPRVDCLVVLISILLYDAQTLTVIVECRGFLVALCLQRDQVGLSHEVLQLIRVIRVCVLIGQSMARLRAWVPVLEAEHGIVPERVLLGWLLHLVLFVLFHRIDRQSFRGVFMLMFNRLLIRVKDLGMARTFGVGLTTADLQESTGFSVGAGSHLLLWVWLLHEHISRQLFTDGSSGRACT